MHLLQEMGLSIPVPPAIGPDSGRDIVCEEPSKFAQKGYRWLVSCKHFAGSASSVGVNTDWAKPHKLIEHGCNGFMFFFSSAYTEGFRASVESICNRTGSPYKIFNKFDIEQILLSSPRYYPIIRQYFPISYERLVTRINGDQCCNFLTPMDALYAIYVRSEPFGGIVYSVMGECCVEGYLDYLDSNGIEYGMVQIRASSYV